KILPHLLEMTNRKNKNIEVVNEYGVTEAAVMSTIFRRQQREKTIKIGHPIWNTRLYILNKWHKPQPIGAAGELCIAGVGLARGYLNRPELTAERFLSFSYRSYRSYKTYIPEKIYKTGDLARWLPDGTVEFLGRIDLQVKIRGYRIEPGEIEKRLLNHPGIKEALVMARQHENGEKYLCVYVVGASSSKGVQAIEVSSLREYLSGELPDYMVPGHFVLLEKIPLTPNGKVDMKALPAPKIESGQEYAAPRDDIERRLVKIWLEVLGREPSASIGIDDNFFRLGGHSLNTTILATRIHQAFHVELSLSEVFKRRTVRKLGEYIRQAHHKAYIGIEPVEKMEYYPLSSAQKRLYFLQQMDLESTAYNMP
ncbi:MAG: AMP-binding protein, partial [Candidatus Aminicenantes bacterium]|nr:AMP-binding protein [Candidatus Aminicenantes bacterium]NIM84101.1 AMP-binding protein [Candidatus Aminicenantes bacterium]NIN23551.1 AMP-binding protein [Candidatus Aminicenantes bacterium]NIN47256.1 AMP-binding protein [Candidatus Aminicenantes bacterium]NIN90183.1 AMP-binding protein [Candidatus Aminicenantes bacterium]